jgi:hypothetical protein
MMAQIYQNAKLTISAASASHCYEGFFREGYAFLNLSRQPIRVNETEFCTVLVSNSFNSSQPTSSWAAASPILQPINRRAWTLQEATSILFIDLHKGRDLLEMSVQL